MYRCVMDDVVDALEAETRELTRYLTQLTDSQWRRPSSCPGWSVSDVVLHLAQSEEGVIATFDHGNAGVALARHAAAAGSSTGGAVDAIVDAAVRAERPENPADVLDRWIDANTGVLDRFRHAEPGLRLNWISVPLSARTLAATRLAEHWIHGMDIREPLGDPADDTSRLWFVTRLAWRTLPYAFSRAGVEVPSVALRLTAPSGDSWDFGDYDSDVTVTGLAGEWCRVAARRIRPADTSLLTKGSDGARVLELVRTYA